MNKLITINLSYYNQESNVLMRHINYWNNFPDNIKSLFTFYIIDDCSQTPVEQIINNYELLDIHIYKITTDLYCNIGGVRNLGANECKTPWLIILDMDTYINNKIAIKLIDLAKDNLLLNNVFKFNRIVPENNNHKNHLKPHPAICLIRKKDYWNIGGCDEDLVGHYGYTDPTFWHKAKGKVHIIQMNDIYIEYYTDGEANINRDISHNKKLFEYKRIHNDWSKDYIRFQWIKVL